CVWVSFFFQAEDGIRDDLVTGVQTCALPIFGGYVIARSGLLRGMHALFIGTILCGIVTLFVVTRVRIERIAGHPTNIRGVWRAEIGRASCRERGESSGCDVA